MVLELDCQQRGKAESLNYFYLRSPLTNEMVPLSALAKVGAPKMGPLSRPGSRKRFRWGCTALFDLIAPTDSGHRRVALAAALACPAAAT